MNARQLKAAFCHKSTVYSDDKKSTINFGYISKVIYYLSDSGKRLAKGEVQPWNKSQAAKIIPCRHIHFLNKNEKKGTPKSDPDEHMQSIINAFLNVLPVVAVVPNVGKCEGYIKEIVYWRTQKGNIQCSAVVMDSTCKHSTAQVRLKYIAVAETGLT